MTNLELNTGNKSQSISFHYLLIAKEILTYGNAFEGWNVSNHH